MDEQVYFAVDAFIYSGYYKWGIFCLQSLPYMNKEAIYRMGESEDFFTKNMVARHMSL